MVPISQQLPMLLSKSMKPVVQEKPLPQILPLSRPMLLPDPLPSDQQVLFPDLVIPGPLYIKIALPGYDHDIDEVKHQK